MLCTGSTSVSRYTPPCFSSIANLRVLQYVLVCVCILESVCMTMCTCMCVYIGICVYDNVYLYACAYSEFAPLHSISG
jgi:hypothetical protein